MVAAVCVERNPRVKSQVAVWIYSRSLPVLHCCYFPSRYELSEYLTTVLTLLLWIVLGPFVVLVRGIGLVFTCLAWKLDCQACHEWRNDQIDPNWREHLNDRDDD